MIELNIPGRGIIQLEQLVCDVHGTLAIDGQLHEGLVRILTNLQDRVTLHLLTADTHGRQHTIDQLLNIRAERVQQGDEAQQKANYIEKLGHDRVAAIGQGSNDAAMLKAAAIGVGILSLEGAATETLLAADLIMPDIFAALELFEKPLRMVATLRK